MRIASHHMGLAVGAAALIHVAAAIAMAVDPQPTGAASAGVGGIQVSLGPSGGAPGSAAEVVSDMDVAEPATPGSAPAVEPETPPPEMAEVENVPLETPVDQAPPDAVQVAATPPEAAPTQTEVLKAEVESPPDVMPVETPVKQAEIVEPVDEVTALARPEAADVAPPPEPVAAEPMEPPASVAVRAVEAPAPQKVESDPDPVAEAHAVPQAAPVDAPPLPVTRPQPPTPEKMESDHAPAQQQAAVAVEAPPAESPQPAPAQASGSSGRAGTGKSDRAGSADSASGGGKPGVSVDYVSILQAWLEEHKEYPRRARSRRQEGVVWLYFVMDRAGHVLEHRIDRSSGHRLLDREVEEMIRRAQPLPAMPSEMVQARLELVVPVQFQLR